MNESEPIRLDLIGTNFLHQQKIQFLWSIIFPIINLFVQIGLIISFFQNVPSPIQPPVGGGIPAPFRDPQALSDLLTPPIVLLLYSVFALILFGHWYKINHEFRRFKIQQSSFQEMIQSEPTEDSEEQVDMEQKEYPIKAKNSQYITLSQIFYNNRTAMERIRILFFIVVFMSIVSFIYFVRLILNDFNLIPPGPLPPVPHFLHILDYLIQIGLIIYIIFQWKMTSKWHKKFKQFSAFEQQIHNEVFGEEDIDDSEIEPF